MSEMQSTIQNRTIFCKDNLEVLRGMNTGSIDLIYLDPPFNKKKTFTAPITSTAKGASFKDIFQEEDVKAEWVETIREDNVSLYELLDFARKSEGRTSYNFCYLSYMAIRLIEIHRVLKDTGSVYLHCDPTMSHYLKLSMDCIFGEKNFRNEIIWCYTFPGNFPRDFPRRHDVLFRYSKTDTRVFNKHDISLKYKAHFTPARGVQGHKDYDEAHKIQRHEQGKTPEDWWTDISNVSQWKNELVGYPTQKPLALLERIIKSSSNEGDIVLDPFCGCATTCVAAEKLQRKWIGVDISVEAFNVVKKRLSQEVEMNGTIFYEPSSIIH